MEREERSETPGWGSILGGVALVGMSAGYAALALRFRNMNAGGSSRLSAVSAEMKASESMSKQWDRTSARARAYIREDASERAQRATGGARKIDDLKSASWAYGELGLMSGSSAAQAKEAFHKGALQTHPDRSGGQSDEAFKRLSHAYTTVLDDLALRR